MMIKKLRTKKNWSQEHLAVLAGLNVRTIQRIEKGQTASLETLKSLASVFEVEVETLTQTVTLIDKRVENWLSQPWWFRLAFFGIDSRKAQVFAEFSLLLCGLAALFLFDNKYAVAGLFIASYVAGLSVRYGDEKQVW